MKKKLFLLLFVLMFTFPILYGLLSPEPNVEIFALNLSSLVFVGGFAKVTGVFTGMKGKLGGAVMQTWKGIQVIRTHVIPANPQSSGQTTNRTLLTNIVNMFKGIVVSFVRVYWNPFVTSKQTGWGNLIGVNQKFQAGEIIDYELIQITKGSLPGEDILTATYATATGSVDVSFVDSGSEGSLPGDLAMLCVFNKDTGKWKFSTGGDVRSDEGASLVLASGLDVTDLTAYLFLFTKNAVTDVTESISDSDAMETVAPV